MSIMSPEKISKLISPRLLEILLDDGIIEVAREYSILPELESTVTLVMKDHWEEITGDLTFEKESKEIEFHLEGERPSPVTINRPKVVNIHSSCSGHSAPPSVAIQKPRFGVGKLAQIEENLLILANLGIHFERLSTYHVRVHHKGEAWNLYLSGKEKYMRDGLPEEGRGIDNFIEMVTSK